jgi:hypothetical protein
VVSSRAVYAALLKLSQIGCFVPEEVLAEYGIVRSWGLV